MLITKFQHACFMVEQDSKSLIVDPGAWSDDFIIPENVSAIIITHEHQDHLDKSKLAAVINDNPDAVIIGHSDVMNQLAGMNTKSVNSGESLMIGGFELEFFGGEHAIISPDLPTIANLGVMINGELYYGGDSFSAPRKPVSLLALPVSAPWMKYSEVEAYLQSVKPSKVFPTHDAILSDKGKELADRMTSRAAERIGARYERLPSATPIKI